MIYTQWPSVSNRGGGVYTENLLKGTKDFSGEWEKINLYRKEENKYNGFTVLSTEAIWNGIGQAYYADPGYYTFSLFVKSEVDTTNATIYTIGYIDGIDLEKNAKVNRTSFTKVISKQWSQQFVTFQVLSSGYLCCRLETENQQKRYCCGFKLEHGINYHPFWTPNPMDVYTE